jgi:cytochrome b6-f complex iron-sulfur subunit
MIQSRKDFLKSLGIVTIGACCGAMILSLEGCASVSNVSASRSNNQVLVKRSDLIGKTSVLVNHETLKSPIFLHKANENEYTAVLMLCTHKQCELSPAGSILHCPCHGSEFSQDGKVLQGPAEADLERYKVTVEGDNIIIIL